MGKGSLIPGRVEQESSRREDWIRLLRDNACSLLHPFDALLDRRIWRWVLRTAYRLRFDVLVLGGRQVVGTRLGRGPARGPGRGVFMYTSVRPPSP